MPTGSRYRRISQTTVTGPTNLEVLRQLRRRDNSRPSKRDAAGKQSGMLGKGRDAHTGPMATDSERVRQFLGEVIPSGGSENDTMFTNVQIEDLLLQADGDVDAAVLSGWRQKAAEFAELVDVQEGTSKRAMSDLHKNALAMRWGCPSTICRPLWPFWATEESRDRLLVRV